MEKAGDALGVEGVAAGLDVTVQELARALRLSLAFGRARPTEIP
jgi:hypothetical protein